MFYPIKLGEAAIYLMHMNCLYNKNVSYENLLLFYIIIIIYLLFPNNYTSHRHRRKVVDDLHNDGDVYDLITLAPSTCHRVVLFAMSRFHQTNQTIMRVESSYAAISFVNVVSDQKYLKIHTIALNVVEIFMVKI